MLSKCKSILSKYKSIVSNYKKVYFQSTTVYFRSTKVYFRSTKVHFQSTKVYIPSAKVYFQSTKVHFQITKVYFQSTTVDFRSTKVYLNLGNRISGIRNLLNTFGSRNPVPTSRNHWNPFLEPRNPGVYPNLGTHRNRFLERFPECGFWNLGTLEPVPGPSSPGTYPNLGTLEPVPGTSSPTSSRNGSRNRFLEPPALELILTLKPVPGTSSPTGSRNGSRNFPGTLPELSRNPFFPGTAPARPAHTEIYIVQRPHSILLLGKNLWNM